VRVRHTATPLSLGKILKEVDGLVFLVQRLDSRVVGVEQSVREEIEAKLLQARHQLAEIIIQRTE
jgi:hypothetical protein